MTRRCLLPVLWLLLTSTSALSASVADAMKSRPQASFTTCGRPLTYNRTVSLAALDGLKGFIPDDALKRQGYRAKNAYGARLTYNGDLNWLAAQFGRRCGQWQAYSDYGLATDGVNAYVITATPAFVDPAQTGAWVSAFLEATNRARFQGQKCGGKLMKAVGPLVWDDRLAAAAQRHANDMVRLDFRGHVNPIDQSRAQQRGEALGFRGVIGENIAYGPLSAQEAVKNLLTSPEHCLNLMDSRWVSFGGGLTNGTLKTMFATYWVQVFGTERTPR